jgi:hypothetical protein
MEANDEQRPARGATLDAGEHAGEFLWLHRAHHLLDRHADDPESGPGHEAGVGVGAKQAIDHSALLMIEHRRAEVAAPQVLDALLDVRAEAALGETILEDIQHFFRTVSDTVGLRRGKGALGSGWRLRRRRSRVG